MAFVLELGNALYRDMGQYMGAQSTRCWQPAEPQPSSTYRRRQRRLLHTLTSHHRVLSSARLHPSLAFKIPLFHDIVHTPGLEPLVRNLLLGRHILLTNLELLHIVPRLLALHRILTSQNLQPLDIPLWRNQPMLRSRQPSCRRQRRCYDRRRRTHHAQQPPHRITRLRAHTQPVLRAHRVQADILHHLPLLALGELRDRVVGADNFDGLVIPRRPVPRLSACAFFVGEEVGGSERAARGGVPRVHNDDVVDRRMCFSEAGEADADDHFCCVTGRREGWWWGVVRWVGEPHSALEIFARDHTSTWGNF